MSTPASTTTTVNISMPTKIREAMRDRMADGGYENASEYVRHLIREDLKRVAHEKLEAELLEGEASGPAERADAAWWAKLRAELAEKVAQRKTA
jgi:antitoxin ParD1/3/4